MTCCLYDREFYTQLRVEHCFLIIDEGYKSLMYHIRFSNFRNTVMNLNILHVAGHRKCKQSMMWLGSLGNNRSDLLSPILPSVSEFHKPVYLFVAYQNTLKKRTYFIFLPKYWMSINKYPLQDLIIYELTYAGSLWCICNPIGVKLVRVVIC